jgi:hypothetical protein
MIYVDILVRELYQIHPGVGRLVDCYGLTDGRAFDFIAQQKNGIKPVQDILTPRGETDE